MLYLKERLMYSVPVVLIMVVPDAVFFHSGVLTLVGLIVAYMGWKKGPDFGALLEREGLHPRGLLPGRTIVREVKEPVDVQEPMPEMPLLPFDDAPKEPSSGELQALKAMGYLAPGADYVVSVRDDGTPITMRNLRSLGIGGRQGVGKTVSMLNLVIQSIPKYDGNIRFLVIDPHMNIDPEGEEADNALAVKLKALGPFLLRVPGMPDNPVAGGKKLLSWLRWIEKEFKERLGTDEVPGKKADQYIVIVADEFAGLLNDPNVGPVLLDLLVQINEQARKVKMFALVASPTWKASRMQGTDLRNSIATFVLHNMPSAIAQQIVEPDVAQKAPKLRVGQAISYTNGEMETGWVPFAKPVDLQYVVQEYQDKARVSLPPAKAHSSTVQAVLTDSNTQTPVVNATPLSYEEGVLIHRHFNALQEADVKQEHMVRAIAVLIYGPNDPTAEEKVRHVLHLKEKHGV